MIIKPYQSKYNKEKIKKANRKFKKPISWVKAEGLKAKGTLKYFNVKSEYQEYLQSPHWQALKTKKLIDAEYRCQICYSDNQLEVHHRTYIRRGNEKLSDLTVLCHNCHQKFHNI